MGLKQVLQSLAQVVNTTYERRIRAASLVKEYRVGGHGHSADAHPQHEAAAAELRHGQVPPAAAHAGESLEAPVAAEHS